MNLLWKDIPRILSPLDPEEPAVKGLPPLPLTALFVLPGQAFSFGSQRLMLAAAVGFIYSRDSELVARPGKRSLSGVQPSPLYIIPLILFLCFSLYTLIGVHKHTRAHLYTCVHTLACTL